MDYSDMETEQKLEFCKQRLGAWATVIGGNVVTKSDDDEVELRTRLGERALRVVVDYDTGWTDLQFKIANTTGVLVLQWDPDKKPEEHERDPEWDEGGEQRMFLAPGVFLEEYPDEAKAMWELIGRVPQPLMQEIVQAMPTRISYLTIDADKIDMRFVPNFHELPDPSHLQWLFAMADRIAKYFEAGSESVAAKPKLYIGGKAANVASMASCPHCNTVVDLSEGSFCYNCGAPMKPKV